MPLLEDLKKTTETSTGWGRPSRGDLECLVRKRKPHTFRFRDDGVIPNNARLPLGIYRTPVRLPETLDPAAIFEELFARNGWAIHGATVSTTMSTITRVSTRCWVSRGRVVELKAGDVAILPAGTGHQALSASRDFLVVGAYPPAGKYDECRGTAQEHARALVTIRRSLARARTRSMALTAH